MVLLTISVAAAFPSSDAAPVPNIVIKSSQVMHDGRHIIQSKVEEDRHSENGRDIAYNDTKFKNMDGVGQLNESKDLRPVNGIVGIAYIDIQEQTEYTVEVTADGNYSATFRIGTPAISSKESTVMLTVDDAPSRTIAVPSTGSSEIFMTVSAPLSLSAGKHVIQISYSTGYLLIDWFGIIRGETASATITAPTLVPMIVPTSAPTTLPATVHPSPSSAELQARLDSATSAGNARLASMRAAYAAWKVPTPTVPTGATNVQTAGLKADGVTDNTAALQALITAKPSGSVLYFPAGTYRINGPVTITKPVTLLGTSGTVFNCKSATGNVFTIKGGSLSSKMSGVTVTGIVVEGPGIETSPAMFVGTYLQGAHFSRVKFHNIGYAAIRLNGCADAMVEDCVFDNVFLTGTGYGVVITDYSDGITIRNNFFVTKGRHGVTTGTSNSALPVEGYVRRVTIENNYLENMQEGAIDTHSVTIGPFVVRNNVVYNSGVGVSLRGGLADISGNVIISSGEGIRILNTKVSASSIGSKVDRVVGNTMIGMRSAGIEVDKTNSVIQNNVARGPGAGYGIYLGPTAYTPSSALITGNVLENWRYGFYHVSSSNAGMSVVNDWMKSGGVFQKLVV